MNENPDPFQWIHQRLEQLDQTHLRRRLRERTSHQSDTVTLGSDTLLNFGSNDYLGLARDSRIAEAVKKSMATYGWGSGASPLITGHSQLHRELEHCLAEFEGCEAALLFPTGFAANVGTITALADKSTTIFSDAKNHASIIDGCRLSAAQVVVFPHNDMDFLSQALSSTPSGGRKLIVTDGLFSMDGDLAPIPAIAELAESHQAMLLVDEAHATGVLGTHGRGTCEHFGVESKCIVRVGTMSKALGSLGGFVLGSQQVIDLCINHSRTLIFSTAAPAAVCAAGLAAIHIVQSEPHRRQQLLASSRSLKEQLRDDFNVGESSSQIIPVLLGSPDDTMKASTALRDAGFLVPGIRPPSVPDGESLLRISLSYDHTPEMIERLVAALKSIKP